MEQVAFGLALFACLASSFTAAMVWGYFLETTLHNDDN